MSFRADRHVHILVIGGGATGAGAPATYGDIEADLGPGSSGDDNSP